MGYFSPLELAQGPAGDPGPPAVYVQVSAGGGNNCGLRSGGQALCWGNDNVGQASPPPFFP